jgi:predicted site-specific integrase-resolvase
MKAKEVMEKYGISRNTLSTWVKKGWIEIEILPSGRYRYKIIESEDGKSIK